MDDKARDVLFAWPLPDDIITNPSINKIRDYSKAKVDKLLFNTVEYFDPEDLTPIYDLAQAILFGTTSLEGVMFDQFMYTLSELENEKATIIHRLDRRIKYAAKNSGETIQRLKLQGLMGWINFFQEKEVGDNCTLIWKGWSVLEEKLRKAGWVPLTNIREPYPFNPTLYNSDVRCVPFIPQIHHLKWDTLSQREEKEPDAFLARILNNHYVYTSRNDYCAARHLVRLSLDKKEVDYPTGIFYQYLQEIMAIPRQHPLPPSLSFIDLVAILHETVPAESRLLLASCGVLTGYWKKSGGRQRSPIYLMLCPSLYEARMGERSLADLRLHLKRRCLLAPSIFMTSTTRRFSTLRCVAIDKKDFSCVPYGSYFIALSLMNINIPSWECYVMGEDLQLSDSKSGPVLRFGSPKYGEYAYPRITDLALDRHFKDQRIAQHFTVINPDSEVTLEEYIDYYSLEQQQDFTTALFQYVINLHHKYAEAHGEADLRLTSQYVIKDRDIINRYNMIIINIPVIKIVVEELRKINIIIRGEFETFDKILLYNGFQYFDTRKLDNGDDGRTYIFIQWVGRLDQVIFGNRIYKNPLATTLHQICTRARNAIHRNSLQSDQIKPPWTIANELINSLYTTLLDEKQPPQPERKPGRPEPPKVPEAKDVRLHLSEKMDDIGFGIYSWGRAYPVKMKTMKGYSGKRAYSLSWIVLYPNMFKIFGSFLVPLLLSLNDGDLKKQTNLTNVADFLLAFSFEDELSDREVSIRASSFVVNQWQLYIPPVGGFKFDLLTWRREIRSVFRNLYGGPFLEKEIEDATNYQCELDENKNYCVFLYRVSTEQ
jgi:hypothetical protein